MVRTKGPLLSVGASGSLAKTLTFSTWKGRSYARKLGKPTNNQQAAQLGMRAALTFLSQQWEDLPTAYHDTFAELATQRQITLFDAYIGYNLSRIADNLAPAPQLPPVIVDNGLASQINFIYPSERFVTIEVVDMQTGFEWANFIYRSPNTGFTPGPSNLIIAYYGNGQPAPHDVVDHPPSHGTWYYQVAQGDIQGNLYYTSHEVSVAY